MKRSVKRFFVALLVVLLMLEIVFPAGNGLFSLGMGEVYAYEVWGDWQYTILQDGTIEITGYNGSASELIIPSEINGISVTSIGEQLFFCCSSLTSIELPESIKSIGDYSFSYCDGLTSIELPEGVTSIGKNAFAYCSSLTSIEISESVTSIGENAFLSCSNLVSIEIPENVTSIGERAFSGCSSLTEIVVTEANEVYDSREGSNAIIHTSSHELILGCKNTKIPDDITSIGAYAFSECGLTSIEIPESVTSIGERAFSSCRNLASIDIPDNVTSIGAYAFSYCGSLTSVELPDSLTSIEGYVFYGCYSLKSVDIPDNVASIGVCAFYGCSSLTGVELSDSLTSIGVEAFLLCSSLTSIKIPNDVTSIGERAFSCCYSLTSIEIPENVTSIGSGAFLSCNGLVSIKVAKANEVYDSRDGSNAIIHTSSNTLILGCKNTRIPNNVTSIGDYAFSGCRGLTNIEIPENVTSIGVCAFYGCSDLSSIKLSRGLTSIAAYAFEGCSGKINILYKGKQEEWNRIDISETAMPKDVIITYEGDIVNINKANISLSVNSYTYDGKEKKPTIIVTNGTTILVNGTDYTVKYANNINIGTATVIITGKGNYTGTVTKTFTIKPTEKQVEKPSKVKSLKQKASYSTNAITLTWNKVDGADGYEVYRATSKKGKFAKVATVTKTSYKNSKLKAGKTYYYKVRAYKNTDKSKVYGDYSAIVAAGTQTAKPSLKATAGKKKATLTWKKVTGADGYEVYMSSSKNGKYKKLKTVKAKTVKYTKSKLTKGKKYYFKIRNYRTVSGKKICSGWSAVKSVKIK